MSDAVVSLGSNMGDRELNLALALKMLSDFPHFSVVDGPRFAKKCHGVTIKTFAIKFPECEDYAFAIAGLD